jgi:hypothetical protein
MRVQHHVCGGSRPCGNPDHPAGGSGNVGCIGGRPQRFEVWGRPVRQPESNLRFRCYRTPLSGVTPVRPLARPRQFGCPKAPAVGFDQPVVPQRGEVNRRPPIGRVSMFRRTGYYTDLSDLPLLRDNLVFNPIIDISRNDLPVQQVVLTFVRSVFDNRLRPRFADSGKLVEIFG